MNGWGGAREGAGRKVGWRKENSCRRKNRSLVAFDDEWQIIKKFAELVKSGEKDKARQFVDQF